ncbi:hypothetical protein SAMN05444365_103135 [Micromonospora pattaloongensis]|uniref:Uncharacterized protein n=1 Tax=Micromonospora pattaloongensis TaxID=405436 RepID=A0A1H3LYB4_9ACTN|nr:hypothetical protein [Micromonospora pattaloongensis]SDY68998.1 hypothetical protein SAMN05444365_103135 [Micromonospora pattaloongensis]
MDGPYAGASKPMPDELVRHYRDTLTAHADDPALGACPRCERSRCDEWRWAYEQLVMAGRLEDLWAGTTTTTTGRARPGTVRRT